MINTDALDHNFFHLSKLNPHQPILPVLKSNAYGHDIKIIARQCAKRKPPFVIVDNIPEYNNIKTVYSGPILIIGESLPINYRTLNHRRVHLAVGSIDLLTALAKTGIPFSIHLFLDTGMSREGLALEDLPSAITIIRQSSLHLIGYTTHLAISEEPDHHLTIKQYKRFEEGLGILIRGGLHPRWIHCTNTGAVNQSPSRCTARRVGTGLYGINPWWNNDDSPSRVHQLRLALTRSTKITKIDEYPANSSISYNATYITQKNTKLAVLPCGYFEGLPRCGSGKLIGIHKDGLCFQRGLICMNMSIREIPTQACRGDTIHLLVTDKDSPASLYNRARQANTIPLDIIVHINQGLRRVPIRDNDT